MRTAPGSARRGFLLLAVALAPLGCRGSGNVGGAGSSEGGSNGFPEAAAPPVDAAGAATSNDASVSNDAGASADSDTDAPSTSTGGPDWANWPMPNPPSSDFPNPASYDTSVAGVVVDKVTGLMWQRADVASSATSIVEAAPYCASLRLAGYEDWRLPSRIEVWSIEDFMVTGPALDPTFSTVGTANGAAVPWTTTPNFDGYHYGGVIFGGGDGGPAGSMSVDSWSGSMAEANGVIRCVRGSTAQASPHYTVQGGTVLDNGTKLTWEQGFDPAPSLPNGVASYCASLTLAGGGWRGPSVKELETIVDDTRIAPSLDTTTFQVPSNATNSTEDGNESHFLLRDAVGTGARRFRRGSSRDAVRRLRERLERHGYQHPPCTPPREQLPVSGPLREVTQRLDVDESPT